MSVQGEMGSWELWGIAEKDWQSGWRRTLEAAVDAARLPLDEPTQIKILVWKRSDNAVHDYKVEP